MLKDVCSVRVTRFWSLMGKTGSEKVHALIPEPRPKRPKRWDWAGETEEPRPRSQGQRAKSRNWVGETKVPRLRTRDPGAEIQDPRVKTLEWRPRRSRDSGAEAQESRLRSRDLGVEMQEPRSKNQDPRAKTQELRPKIWGPGSRDVKVEERNSW